ncbi:MAG: molybdopterin molybdotransferase [Halocynthiibacter sp.]|jgi:molybdopterin molybdotransferase
MISVEEALSNIFALCAALPEEFSPLSEAAGRILARPVAAMRDQPPFAASAMDGYAVADANPVPGARYKVIGEAAAGHRFSGAVGPGEAVRIFTGAPVPSGGQHVVIQEDVSRIGDELTLLETLGDGPNIRPPGNDFARGSELSGPRRLSPSDIALLASMNIPQVPVIRRPVVAIIATGDELCMPGEEPGPDQIIASNSFGLKAMVEAEGGLARLLPIARDNPGSLRLALELAADADLIVTIGGASVGDHDIVAQVAGDLGLARSFYKVAIRPGKPLMAGRLGGAVMIGLPGNPVSAMVCGQVFLLPALRVLMGLPAAPAPQKFARLSRDIGSNGPRAHYMRAELIGDEIAPFQRQDSALLSVLSGANALLLRPPHDPARKAGELMGYLPFG